LKKLLIIVSVLFLTACGSGVDVKATSKERFTKYDENINITKDKETGCKYIIISMNSAGRFGITPLLNSQGEPVCDLTGDY
jgi:hypothetical protein